jgi:hypothetical protein
MAKQEYTKKVALTRSQLSRGGTTLVGVTIAQSLDEIIAELRGQGGGFLDPMSIRVSTERITAFGEPSLGVTVTIDQRNVIEVAR